MRTFAAMALALIAGSFATAWDDGHFGTYLRSSAIVTASVVLVSGVLSILAGYAFGQMRFRGAEPLFYVFLLGLMVPMEAMIVPLYIPTAWYARLKRRRRDITWLKYF